MANKTKATPQKEEAREKGPETPDAPLPLLDLSDDTVMKMIKGAKKRGYVTYEQLNSVLATEEVTCEQIEDILLTHPRQQPAKAALLWPTMIFLLYQQFIRRKAVNGKACTS
jgi:hypothetical protein